MRHAGEHDHSDDVVGAVVTGVGLERELGPVFDGEAAADALFGQIEDRANQCVDLFVVEPGHRRRDDRVAVQLEFEGVLLKAQLGDGRRAGGMLLVGSVD